MAGRAEGQARPVPVGATAGPQDQGPRRDFRSAPKAGARPERRLTPRIRRKQRCDRCRRSLPLCEGNQARRPCDWRDAGRVQVGGSLGTALLITVATTATTSFVGGKAAAPALAAAAAVHGYTTAFWWAAAIFAAGALAPEQLQGRLTGSNCFGQTKQPAYR